MQGMSLETKALYEIYRNQILLNVLANPDSGTFPTAFVYAVYKRTFPYFHHSDDDVDPFEGCYKVEREFMSEVIGALDALWLKGEPIPTFYKLEEEFGGKEVRGSLIRTLRYSRLNDGFDDAFYGAILAPMHHPIEASSIIEPFRVSDLLLF